MTTKASNGPRRTASNSVKKQNKVTLQTLESIDSIDIFNTSDFASSLDQWHKEHSSGAASSSKTAGKEAAKNGLPRKVPIIRPRLDSNRTATAKRDSDIMVRVASCASPSDLYTRGRQASTAHFRQQSVKAPRTLSKDRQPSVKAPLQHRQPSVNASRTSIPSRQPSINTPRTPIQERQPPWRQGSEGERPKPCVSQHMQKKLAPQRSSLPKLASQRSSLPKPREQPAESAQRVTAPAGIIPREDTPAASVLRGAAESPSSARVKDLQQNELSMSREGSTSRTEGTPRLDAVHSEQSTEDKVALSNPAEPLTSDAQTEQDAYSSWASKVVEKVASSQTAGAGTDAPPEALFTIKSLPAGASITPTGAVSEPSSAQSRSALGETGKRRGMRLPWTPRGGRLISPWGSARSPKLTTDGALAHIDPKILVTKKLPKIKVRSRSQQEGQPRKGRGWAMFACFHTPVTVSS